MGAVCFGISTFGCRGEYSGSDTGLGMFGLGVSITVFGSECCNVVCGILTLDFDRSKETL